MNERLNVSLHGKKSLDNNVNPFGVSNQDIGR
jgi:hypothetical protein